MIFPPAEHPLNPPETWIVRKVDRYGRRWGLFAVGHDAPLDTFSTKREANEAKVTGRLVDLYVKEGRWYAGENIPGWKPFRESVLYRTPV